MSKDESIFGIGLYGKKTYNVLRLLAAYMKIDDMYFYKVEDLDFFYDGDYTYSLSKLRALKQTLAGLTVKDDNEIGIDVEKCPANIIDHRVDVVRLHGNKQEGLRKILAGMLKQLSKRTERVFSIFDICDIPLVGKIDDEIVYRLDSLYGAKIGRQFSNKPTVFWALAAKANKYKIYSQEDINIAIKVLSDDPHMLESSEYTSSQIKELFVGIQLDPLTSAVRAELSNARAKIHREFNAKMAEITKEKELRLAELKKQVDREFSDRISQIVEEKRSALEAVSEEAGLIK